MGRTEPALHLQKNIRIAFGFGVVLDKATLSRLCMNTGLSGPWDKCPEMNSVSHRMGYIWFPRKTPNPCRVTAPFHSS